MKAPGEGVDPGKRRGGPGQDAPSIKIANPSLTDTGRSTPSVYGTSTIRSRRSTKAELAALHTAILEICEEDQPLSVRAVYYRAVSQRLIRKTKSDYRKICREVLKLRRAGDLPYRWITDGTRLRIKKPIMGEQGGGTQRPGRLLPALDVARPADYIEVWAEKDAINGMIAPITDKWDVPLMIARGYSSETFLWNAAQDMKAAGKPATIYQVGDHDPDGIRAWNDIQKKLRGFAPEVDLNFHRLAVTPDQVEEYWDLTRPTKGDDAARFGPSMDVDAIPSRILRGIVNDAITSHIDERTLEVTQMVEAQELEGLESLLAMAKGWTL